MSRMKEHVAAQIVELDPIRVPAEQPTTLAEAIAAAQAEMQNPKFDKTNPHFKSKFASLAAVRDAVVPVMARHGVALTQTYRMVDGMQLLVTTLRKGHEVIESEVPLPPFSKPQEWASLTTYIRRVSMMAIAGVCGDEDDDAEEAMQRNTASQKPVVPPGFDAWWQELGDTVNDGWNALEAFWTASRKDLRAHVMHHHQPTWNSMKAAADKISKSAKP